MDLDSLELPEEVKANLDSIIQQKAREIADPLVEETVKGLKAKNSELLGKLKTKEADFDDMQNKVAKMADGKGDQTELQQLNKALEEKVSSLTGTIEEMNTNAQKQQIDAEAGRMAAKLTKDIQKANLLQSQISARLTLVEDQIRVTDDNGQLTVSSMEELEGSIRSAFPFLIDGSQAQGGGAVRSEGKAQAKLEVTRADFDAMDHRNRAEFVKSGGKIYDE
jgi:predicted nuclease with TOPRIM domain